MADITLTDWQRLSDLKRAAATAFGLKTDAGIGTDAARVLRPVGSTWRKHGTVPVSTKLDAGPYLVEQIEAPLTAYLTSHDALPEARPIFAGLELSNDLSSRDYPPSSLAVVANHCAQVRVMRDTQGDVGYEHWRGVIGLGKYATEGIALVEEWSSRRAATGHSQTNVSDKFNSWSTGPTTCDFLRAANPAGCEGCPHQVKSPIMLGHTAVTEAPKVIPVVEDDPLALAAATPAPTGPAHWPEGYRADNGTLTCFVNPDVQFIYLSG